MGIKYSSADSQNLINAMKNNVQLGNQITDRLASGCDHLIKTVESGELQGAAYTAAKGLFTEVIIPSIKKLQEAIDDIQAELTSYEYADSTVSEYGTLDMDDLERRLTLKEEQLTQVTEQLEEYSSFFVQLKAFSTNTLGPLWSINHLLKETQGQLEADIADLKERIEKLTWFVSDVSNFFDDSLAVLQLAIQGAAALGEITTDDQGNYYTNGTNMDWLTNLKDSSIQTTDRGTDPKVSLIEQHASEMNMSKEAKAYYRQQLLALLEGKPSSDWPILIEAYNEATLFDENNNIISIVPFDYDRFTAYTVLKNGKYDPDYTAQYNQERSAQFMESLGENALQLTAGVATTLIGLILGAGSAVIGTGTVALSLPSGGTVTVPGAALTAATVTASGTMITAGAAITNDAIIKMGQYNRQLEISFASQGPTSKTFGNKVSVRVGNKTYNGVRVDAERDSGKIQIQSGSGKNGYNIDEYIYSNQITDRTSILRELKKLKKLKNISNSELEKLIRNIQKAKKYLDTVGK